jgi:Transmembrane domain of unknown function (DUF3566)
MTAPAPPLGAPDPYTERLPGPPPPRQPRPERPERPAHRRQRRTVTVRRIDPWTVLKLSIVFYFVFLLFFMLAVTLLWTFVEQTGAIDAALDFLREASVNVDIQEGAIGRALFLIGLLAVVAGTGANVFFCFLYNLVADVAGGLRITLEDDS